MIDHKTLLAAGFGALAALSVAPKIALADPIACPAAQAGAPRPDEAININPRRNINHRPSVMGIPLHYDSVQTASTSYGGRGWSLAVPRLAVSGSQAQLTEGGRTTTFQLVSGVWTGPVGEPRKLVQLSGSSFELRGNNGTHVLAFQSGRMTEERNAYRTLAQWSYNGAGNATQVVDPRTGASITLAYDAESRLISATQGNLRQAVGYDWYGRLASISLPYEVGGNPSGHEVSYSYDYMTGVMTSSTDARGDMTTYITGSDGGLLSVRYADTYAVAFTCESAAGGGFTIRKSDSFGQTEEQTHAATGRVVSTADAYGNVTTYGWNGAGQMTSRSADGQSETWTFNASGTLASFTNVLGQTSSYAYSSDRLIGQTDHLGRTTTYGYDANGFLSSISAGGQTTTYVNNAKGDPIQVTTHDGLVSTRVINSMGDVTSVTAPGNLTTTYTLNATGQVTGVSYPDGTMEAFTYRPNGQIASATGRDGRTTSYTYDTRNRMINTQLHGGKNIATDLDNLGRPIRVTRNLGTRPQIEERGYGPHGAVVWTRRNGFQDQMGPVTFAPLGMPTTGGGGGTGSGSGSGSAMPLP